MGYKKYSPFLKSIKVLILFSLMYFTTRLDALNLRIPITSEKFDYHDLPVYCKSSTNHFECKDENGTVYCLPDSMKCRIKCANDAELNCEHTATSCKTGEFRCSGTGDKATCISEHNLCDGRSHCPKADDEHASLCNSRACGPGQFACRSPGHCLPASKRCDGQLDCLRPGLNDKSDEENCVQHRRTSAVCEGGFGCLDGSKCIKEPFVCDGFKDCADNSDEVGCPVVCGEGELHCDGKCFPNSARCDGKFDCSSGEDEEGCRFDQCKFPYSSFFCRHSGKCISSIFTCNGHKDCSHGEDEVCPASKWMCKRDTHWTCKSGSHCVLNSSRCDGKQHCPDGSDEADCPEPTAPAPACPAGRHLCNGTSGHCVLLEDACRGRDACPQPDEGLKEACRLLNSSSPCSENNGGCEQVCSAEVAGASARARCTCRPGWTPASRNASACVDDNECERFGACSQLCRNRPGGYDCSCRQGYSRHGRSCKAPGAAKILFSTNAGIEFVDTDTGRRVAVRAGLQYPKYVAYDAADGSVYFHTRDGVVGRVGIDGSGLRVLARNLTLDAVAYDWTSGLLFYSVPLRRDGRLGQVGVLNVTNGARTRLRTLDCPRGLAVDPETSRLFVSLWCGRRPGLYSMAADGRQLRLLVSSSGGPGHVALDLAASPRRLYWTDAGNRAIASCALRPSGDCDDVRAHWRLNSSRRGLLFDLAVFEDRLYWNDLEHGLVLSVDKWSGLQLRQVAEADAVVSVAVYHSLLQPAGPRRPACHCQHICVGGQGDDATCLCDERYSMAASGACVNGTALAEAANDVGGIDNEADDATPRPAARLPGTSASVYSIAGAAIAAVVTCFVIGAVLAVVCLRRQDPLAVKLESIAKHEHRMPKVNSRTPLTDCEVGMDGTRF